MDDLKSDLEVGTVHSLGVLVANWVLNHQEAILPTD